MGITLKTDIGKEMAMVMKKADEAITEAFTKAGQAAVERIHETKTYRDITGNLSASIGYGVVRHGSLVAVGGFGSGTGGDKGRSFLYSVAGEVSDGLIIVAGMEYALLVERRGRVVLDGGTLEIADNVKRFLENVKIR